MKETRRLREMEELIDLQDKAIQALQQASTALNLALQALQQAAAEKGFQNKFAFHSQYSIPLNVPNNGFVNAIPTNVPFYGGNPEYNSWQLNAPGKLVENINMASGLLTKASANYAGTPNGPSVADPSGWGGNVQENS